MGPRLEGKGRRGATQERPLGSQWPVRETGGEVDTI